jgi:hypothetical protein
MLPLLMMAAAFVVLSVLYARDVRRARRRRGEFFADSLSLFETYRVTQDGMHFPVLEGKYRGLPVRLEPVLDDMGRRKLPSLWLKATLLVPSRERGVLDFIVRPQGIEFYSPSHDLPKRLPIPGEWPQHAILCTDSTGRIPSLDRLTPHMRVFEDQRTKELLVTPRGVRLVYQAAQAQRAEYLVLRQAHFENARVDAALVRTLLDRTIAIAAALDVAEAQAVKAA